MTTFIALTGGPGGGHGDGHPPRRHVMLLPSLACQAQCAYCFGPNRGPSMPLTVFDAALDWIEATTRPGQGIDLTFHGGEPLLAGRAWYEQALPALRRRFGARLHPSLQSNLWLLDDSLAALLAEHGVSIGTSLDGPEAINDAQRGEGYFARSMAGVAAARRHGIQPGAICTFTRRSAAHWREVVEFFRQEGFAFSVHAAAGGPGDGLALSPEEHAGLFADLLDYYLANLDRLSISTLDQMARGMASGQGGLCTFDDCLGSYPAVAPDGGIYPCNRFVRDPERRLGHVQDRPGLDALSASPAWTRLRRREETVREECGECPHFGYCRGGCPYNAAAAGAEGRDPHCPAYRRLFDRIAGRALEEVFADENMASVLEHGPGERGLLHKGRLLQVMRGGPHPQQVARGAREAVAAAALGACAPPEEALGRLDRAGVITQPEAALGSLRLLRARLDDPTGGQRLNAYLHVTYSCNLACDHCYAASVPGPAPSMAVEDVAALVRGAARAGFRKAVITGGEPLAHPERETLLDALAGLRGSLGGLQTVLRTNLALPLPPALLARLARSVDQVVVSVDGDEAAHDARRGLGTYARTLANLRELTDLAGRAGQGDAARVSITAVLPAAQAAGAEGESVRALGRSLGVDVRFKPVLPLGRAGSPDHEIRETARKGIDAGPEPGDPRPALPEVLMCPVDPCKPVAAARARATCGLGMNLYVGPEGKCYPCYALAGGRHALGNALGDGLDGVLARNDAYRRVTVDSNRGCRACALRYLCGGFCRAWLAGDDPDAALPDCRALRERAGSLLRAALETLEVPVERWLDTGLPL